VEGEAGSPVTVVSPSGPQGRHWVRGEGPHWPCALAVICRLGAAATFRQCQPSQRDL